MVFISSLEYYFMVALLVNGVYLGITARDTSDSDNSQSSSRSKSESSSSSSSSDSSGSSGGSRSDFNSKSTEEVSKTKKYQSLNEGEQEHQKTQLDTTTVRLNDNEATWSSVKEVQDVSEKCINCICEATGGCEKNRPVKFGIITEANDVMHDSAYGPLSITRSFWEDAGSPTISGEESSDFTECANDMNCAAKTVRAYMLRYPFDCNGDGVINCLDYVAIHNKGPFDCQSLLPSPYKQRFFKCWTGQEYTEKPSWLSRFFWGSKTSPTTEFTTIDLLTPTDKSSEFYIDNPSAITDYPVDTDETTLDQIIENYTIKPSNFELNTHSELFTSTDSISIINEYSVHKNTTNENYSNREGFELNTSTLDKSKPEDITVSTQKFISISQSKGYSQLSDETYAQEESTLTDQKTSLIPPDYIETNTESRNKFEIITKSVTKPEQVTYNSEKATTDDNNNDYDTNYTIQSNNYQTTSDINNIIETTTYKNNEKSSKEEISHSNTESNYRYSEDTTYGTSVTSPKYTKIENEKNRKQNVSIKKERRISVPHKINDITEECIQCICEAASNCKVGPFAEGLSCGPFRITESYWKDADELIPKNLTGNTSFVNCANDFDCAKNIVKTYMNKYQFDCNDDGVVNCTDYAAIHNNGPYACNEQLPDDYSRRFIKCSADMNEYQTEEVEEEEYEERISIETKTERGFIQKLLSNVMNNFGS